jgi:hypothetical protein
MMKWGEKDANILAAEVKRALERNTIGQSEQSGIIYTVLLMRCFEARQRTILLFNNNSL